MTTSSNDSQSVLIIEDDAIVGAVYKGLLMNRGYDVRLEACAKSGLELMKTFRPDAVILDLMLPNTNGVEVLKQIRKEPGLQDLPVIVFTNAYVPSMLDAARNAGANHVFIKSTLTSRQLLEALALCITPGMEAAARTLPPLSGQPASQTTDPLRPPLPFPQPMAGGSAATEFFTKAQPAEPLGNSPSPAGAPTPAAKSQGSIPEVPAEFLKTIRVSITQLRSVLSELSKPSDETTKVTILDQLHRHIRTFGANAGFSGFRPAADLCSAFELFAAEIRDKPKLFNDSILRTFLNTLDVVNDLVVKRIEVDLLYQPVPSILVVDDEVLSRRAVTFALEKGRLKGTECENPVEALELSATRSFDLILLDVQMPGMDGFELCAKIRAQALNQKTPVIFVTSMSDFKSRVRSTMSGATDLIAKPFPFFELTVKAASTLLQTRVKNYERPGLAAAA
ncbi:MAG: response regulator [Verrucomicrobia bacterium]|nr:response regulator [Verrucomicrobiota bacterium]